MKRVNPSHKVWACGDEMTILFVHVNHNLLENTHSTSTRLHIARGPHIYVVSRSMQHLGYSSELHKRPQSREKQIP